MTERCGDSGDEWERRNEAVAARPMTKHVVTGERARAREAKTLVAGSGTYHGNRRCGRRLVATGSTGLSSTLSGPRRGRHAVQRRSAVAAAAAAAVSTSTTHLERTADIVKRDCCDTVTVDAERKTKRDRLAERSYLLLLPLSRDYNIILIL